MALTSDDLDELYAAYTKDNFARFESACVEMFLNYWIPKIPGDIKYRLLEAIRNARTRRDMWVRFHTEIADDHEIVIDGRRLSTQHILYRTDALKQLAAAIGPNINVRAVPVENGRTALRIEYWPPVGRIIHNPEDEYTDLPPLEVGNDF